MKKLGKLKLINVDKKELAAKKMNLLKGGEDCFCTCGCVTDCGCTGDPISNKSSNSSVFSGMLASTNAIAPGASDHGPY